ncbi:unnamed protein product [Tetraodon nigroviridis]|uniref:(spotted green pufferfish) hypothetical protein n=1 Tax=Tetraodon nigroviridis TaxID=99883 RepID=Q4SP05_TETNG|nr:unnamed protein product [Tetraodon nigroviridis]
MSRRREQRVLFMVVVMVICYLLCWLPYGVVALLATFGPPGLVTPAASIIPSILAKSSTVINPVIYVFMNKQVLPVPALLRGPSLQHQPEELLQGDHQGRQGGHPDRPAPHQPPALHGGRAGPPGRHRHAPAGPLLRCHLRHHQSPLLGQPSAGGGVAGGPRLIRDPEWSGHHRGGERRLRAAEDQPRRSKTLKGIRFGPVSVSLPTGAR